MTLSGLVPPGAVTQAENLNFATYHCLRAALQINAYRLQVCGASSAKPKLVHPIVVCCESAFGPSWEWTRPRANRSVSRAMRGAVVTRYVTNPNMCNARGHNSSKGQFPHKQGRTLYVHRHRHTHLTQRIHRVRRDNKQFDRLARMFLYNTAITRTYCRCHSTTESYLYGIYKENFRSRLHRIFWCAHGRVEGKIRSDL
jgi:hypothetical protein